MTTQLNKRNKLIQEDLAQFRGTERYWRTGAPWHPFLYTDGVQHVAEHGEAYWILDLIGSWQGEPQVKHDPMLKDIQFWTLIVNDDSSAEMRCERDEGDVVVRQEISCTDFPLPEIRFISRTYGASGNTRVNSVPDVHKTTGCCYFLLSTKLLTPPLRRRFHPLMLFLRNLFLDRAMGDRRG